MPSTAFNRLGIKIQSIEGKFSS